VRRFPRPKHGPKKAEGLYAAGANHHLPLTPERVGELDPMITPVSRRLHPQHAC
jgi:hypothetical protein